MDKVIYFETYLAGTTHGDYQLSIKKFAKVGDELTLFHDPENKFDPCAVAVFCHKYLELTKQTSWANYGWIPSSMNHQIADDLQKGIKVKAVVIEKQEPNDEYNFWNLRIQVYKDEPPD
jgi:hypothetical protein